MSTYLNSVPQLCSEKPPADWNDVEKRNAWHDDQDNPDPDPRLVIITDIRGREGDFTLEKRGFKVIRFEHKNEYDLSSNEGIKRT